MEDIESIQILWDYMKMNHELKHLDCIIGLGTMDINVANVASELYLNGYARGYDRFVLKDHQDEGDKKNIEKKLNKISYLLLRVQ